MQHGGLIGDVLVHLADGTAAEAEALCAELWQRNADPHAAAMAAVVQFWRGRFVDATEWSARALEVAETTEARALGLAAAALAAGGDPAVDGTAPWAEGVALVAQAPRTNERGWAAVRYLLVEAALVGARLDDARRLLDDVPSPARSWAGHPFAAVMAAAAVRVAAFSGDIDGATALLPPMREAVVPGHRLEVLVEAVAGLVLGNSDDAPGVQRSTVAATAQLGGTERDFIQRGVLLLLAFGATAVGDAAGAGRLVFAAGDDGDLGSSTIIDRALGLELLLVAALSGDDLASAQAWQQGLEALAEHPVAAPTVLRARARLLHARGDVEAAVEAATASVADCRAGGRMVEAAEGEIVLARARIAARDVAGASRDLRALVNLSDASGHRAVRRSAASALQPAGRRLPPVAGGGWAVLSEREREVARCVLAGLEVDGIAAELFLSAGTVRTHLSRVLCAFGVPSRIGLLAALGASAGGRPDLGSVGRPGPLSPLSPRQGEVAALVANGATNQQIAQELGISVKGVEKHVGDIVTRWGVGSRFDLARVWWAARGAVPAESRPEN